MGIRCFFSGIASFIRCGEWIPHFYQDTYKKTNILASEYGFREGNPDERIRGELSYTNVYLITSKCKYCNNSTSSWCTPNVFVEMGNTLE